MEVSFTINDKPYSISPSTIPIDTSLNTFIRKHAELPGTKYMCLEGGCGVCIVTLKGLHPVTKKPKIWATNSCLTPIYSCHGLDILTVEGIGNRKIGYHPIQQRLCKMNGTQCGYCSPGMVMNMYSLLESKNGDLTMEEVENSFGGNICRCTGYRPILDAFKSFAINSTYCVKDIEELPTICPNSGEICAGSCKKSKESLIQLSFGDSREWFKVMNLQSLFDAFGKIGDKSYMLVAGNTAHGVYRRDRNIQVFIDITDVPELHEHSCTDKLIIGGNVSLTEFMDILTEASKTPGFEFCMAIMKHIDLVANVPVRNNGTIAGNLSIKHQHKEFPSDVFITLEGCGAVLTIADSVTNRSFVSVADYLNVDMNKKVILNVSIPRLDPTFFAFRSYKIMPRAQNAHAYINAAFLMETRDGKVASCRICFGGVNPEFIHATNAEKILKDKDPYTNETLQETLKTMSAELNPDWILPDASPEYRRNLAMSLFYKFIIHTCPSDKVNPEYVSGGPILERPLSSGTQEFDTYKEKWPLTEPVPKYEGLIQCSGEAQYMNDIPPHKNDLWAAFVIATRPHARIGKIDPAEALKIPGVHSFFSAKDIPGKNNMSPPLLFIVEEEKVFLEINDEVLFYGHPVGIICAETSDLANYAANFVKITYVSSGSAKRILPSLLDGYGWDGKTATHQFGKIKNDKLFTQNLDDTKSIQGNIQLGSQYHYTMEPQTTVCLPAEDGVELYTATQWMDHTNYAVAECLGIPASNVNMVIRRIGGGYGGKVSRGSMLACAAAVACRLTNRPIRFVLSIEANMLIMGKRFAILGEYDVSFEDSGKITKLNNHFAEDNGYSLNESVRDFTLFFFKNVYDNKGWENNGERVITDAPSHTWFRAPGSTEGIAMIENIMDHVAQASGKDPLEVRLANIDNSHPMKKMLADFAQETDYYNRKKEIDEFNKSNRWRKRGISIVPMEYPMEYYGPLPAFVSVYHPDGSVAVSHSGVECGQGINTKVAQVAAYTLGVPYESVSVKPLNNLISANSYMTGGSTATGAVCFSVKKACEIIVERMKPVKDELKTDDFGAISRGCYAKNIDMTAKYTMTPKELVGYSVYGTACAEIEVDLLTGNLQLKRVDILEDTGESMSPLMDVGQVEGAFIQGIGYWLTEILVYDRLNGELLSTRTWTYKPPGAKDIPVDFRIKFLQKSSNPYGVLNSKATAEPSCSMAFVVILALRHALNSARKDGGLEESYFHLGAPSPPDAIFLNAGNSIDDYKLT